MNISFPVITYLYGDLSVKPKEGFAVMGIQFPNDETMLCKAPYQRDVVDVPGWLLDAEGRFFGLTPSGRRREWLQPLSVVVRLVKAEYVVAPPRAITVGDLQAVVRDIRDRFREAPVAADLRKFLAKRADDEHVDRALLSEWGI